MENVRTIPNKILNSIYIIKKLFWLKMYYINYTFSIASIESKSFVRTDTRTKIIKVIQRMKEKKIRKLLFLFFYLL